MQNTSANLLEVPSGSLKPGMYVARLDRPWLETPFSVQGFYIRSQQDVQFVAEHCLFVYVDPRRYRNNPGAGVAKTRGYKTKTSLKKEFSKASVELESTNDAIRRVFDRLRAGHKLELLAVQRAIDPLLDSVLRNGEALAALIRIKAKGDYLFNHSVANAVWAAVLGMTGPESHNSATSNLNVNFLRRPALADLVAESRIIRQGRRLAVGEATIYSDGESDPVAHITATYAMAAPVTP